MAAEQRHRLRITVDVIYQGEKLSPSAANNVASDVSTHAHVLAFEDIKNVEVIFSPDERTFYAHHHSSDGDYCRIRNGCLDQANDGLNQDDL